MEAWKNKKDLIVNKIHKQGNHNTVADSEKKSDVFFINIDQGSNIMKNNIIVNLFFTFPLKAEMPHA